MEKQISLNCRCKFEEFKLLQRGAYSEIYLLRNPQNDNRILKRIYFNDKPNPQLLSNKDMCYNEKEILEKFVECEYVVQLKESFYDESQNYLDFYFKYDDEIDLFNFIQNYKLNFEQKKSIAYNLVCAIIAIHKKNIIHNDLKLENVICNPKTLGVKVIDFNLSSDLDKEVIFISKGGSEFYCAPEKKQKKTFDGFKSDSYAFGIILFSIFYEFTPQTLWYRYDIENFPNLFSLLSGLLEESPEYRISLEEAKQHRFFR